MMFIKNEKQKIEIRFLNFKLGSIILSLILISIIFFQLISCGEDKPDKVYKETVIEYFDVDFSPNGDSIAVIEYIYTNHVHMYYSPYQIDYVFSHWSNSVAQTNLVILNYDSGNINTTDSIVIPIIYNRSINHPALLQWYDEDTILIYLEKHNDTQDYNQFYFFNVPLKTNKDSKTITSLRQFDISPDKTKIAFMTPYREIGIMDINSSDSIILDGFGRNIIWRSDTQLFYSDYLVTSVRKGSLKSIIIDSKTNEVLSDTWVLPDIIYDAAYGPFDIANTGDTLFYNSFLLDLDAETQIRMFHHYDVIFSINEPSVEKGKWSNDDSVLIEIIVDTSGSSFAIDNGDTITKILPAKRISKEITNDT